MPTSDNKNRQTRFLLGILIVVCLGCDSLMVPALTTVAWLPEMLGAPLLLAIVGCVLAQGCLLAAWLAWGDLPFGKRLLRHWIVAAVLYLAWVAGFAASHAPMFAKTVFFVGLSVPLVSVGAQLPLWIARQTFGWRLVRGGAESEAGRAPLTIRDLMTATVLVAVSLALARIAPSPDGKPLGNVWIVMFAVPALASTITLLPASAMLLRTRVFWRGVLRAALYALSWVSLLWLVVLISRHWGLFQLPPMAMVVGLSCLILSFAATFILAAAVLRSRGYRLVWGRASRRAHAGRNHPASM